VIPPFLDPNLKPEDLEYGVSFASAATGFDDYTAEVSVHNSVNLDTSICRMFFVI